MNCDSIFRIGKTHTVCEDYTFHSNGETPHIIVCDGSSFAEHSDLGARILAKNTSNLIDTGVFKDKFNLFTDFSIRCAYKDVQSLKLNSECLCSTQLAASVVDDKLKVLVNGDGIVYVKKVDGSVEITTFQYSPISAPFYAYYFLTTKLEKQYHEDFPGQKMLINDSESRIGPYGLEYLLDAFVECYLFSNGIFSFVDDDGKPVHFGEILEVLTQVKNLISEDAFVDGEFVKRRMGAAFKKVFEKNKWINLDDLSMAGMYNENKSQEQGN